MSSPRHYRCEEKVVKILEERKLSLNGLRLVHATYHYLDNHPGWEPQYMNLKAPDGKERICTALCAQLCETTGAPAANDISMIHQGMHDVAGTDLFRTLELDGRKLRFRFGHSLAAGAAKYTNRKFVILDCGIIARLRSPWQVYFYTRAEMVHRQRNPIFYLPRVGPKSEPWQDTKRTWLSAARRVGEIMGHHYVFIPELDDQCEHVIAVRVKVVHRTTQWSEGRLFPRHAPEPVSVVANGKCSTLTRHELRKRKNWTLVDGPAPTPPEFSLST